FPSRNLYRSAVEDLARRSPLDEGAVADRAVALAAAGADPRRADPGWHLIGGGRRALEAEIGFRPPVRLRLRRREMATGVAGYLAAILGLTGVLAGLAVWALAVAGAGQGL